LQSLVRRFGVALAPMHDEEQKDALDNLRNSAGFVGVGNGYCLHRLRVDSHPFSAGADRDGNPSDSRAKTDRLRRINSMPLINIVITLIVVGVVLWLINNFIPMASSIKTILNVVVVVAVAIWVLQAVGLWGRVTSYKFMN
jgi:predicted membrane protein